MADFPIHTLDTAPDASKPLLEDSIKGFGRLPSLHAVMATSPELLEGYKALHGLFQKTSFDAEELTVVWQTINVEHECHYCVPAHTMIANMMKVDPAITEALRNETPLPTAKLEALRNLTLAMLRDRGNVDAATMQAFLDAGYGQQQVLEVVLGLAQKVMSNYVNHLAETPIDAPFADLVWERKAPVAAE